MLSFSIVGLANGQSMAGSSGTGHQTNLQVISSPGEVYTGKVGWVDPDMQRIMVSGPDGSKIFDVSGATMKGMPEPDHFVSVNYTVSNGHMLASSVVMVPKRVALLYDAWYWNAGI